MAYSHHATNLLLQVTFLILTGAFAMPPPVIIPNTAYIVHTLDTSRPPNFLSQDDWYSFLIRSLPRSKLYNATVPKPRIFYTYRAAVQGFAATLTPDEARAVGEHPGVIGVYEDETVELHTTHSPEFIGLNTEYGIWQESSLGDDVIIGLLDTGIWPESESFNDSGLNPVGKEWKGECEKGIRFEPRMCNNKLIGARFFRAGAEAGGLIRFDRDGNGDEFVSPRDELGHGTHTSSTAAGSPVKGASFFGQAKGTARGVAPNAKIAMYKVCWTSGCTNSDILAAVDKAIEDGVHILSISLGSTNYIPYYRDAIAIAVFAAVRRGIFVACSAGNGGPAPGSVTNTAPWIATVTAGTVDRTFRGNLTLGSGEVLSGESLYVEIIDEIKMEMLPVKRIDSCYGEFLEPSEIVGKIVVCFDAHVKSAFLIRAAGGAGLVSISSGSVVAQSYSLPSLSLDHNEGQKLIAYLKSTNSPMARIEYDGETIIGKKRAPQVAFYSSRGPNRGSPEILKPDMLAPGTNILGAWPSEAPISGDPMDPRRSNFSIISGTSMACPHVAGAAALLRRLNPSWSPAMIRSAMMSTAFGLDNRERAITTDIATEDPATPLATGAGLVYPQAALDPGLVYDIGPKDYAKWLCKLNYTRDEIRRFVAEPLNCGAVLADPNWDLNYPSFGVVFNPNETNNHPVVKKRTLTIVSGSPENYTARVVNLAPEKVAVRVTPEKLEFLGTYDKKEYTVEFVSKVGANESAEYAFAHVVWENEKHQVRSPVVLVWPAVEVFE